MIKTTQRAFSQPVTDLIVKRHSVRTYDGEPLTDSLIKEIRNALGELQGPFAARVRIELLAKNAMLNGRQGKLGTYGVIQGAPLFAAAAVAKNSSHNLLQLGYVFEQFILHLTGLGLGTCWLAGSFNNRDFIRAMRLDAAELLPVVSPIGYAGTKKSLIERAMKPRPNLVNRKPWPEMFFAGDLRHPVTAEAAGGFSIPLEMVRLAPSAANKQPWRLLLRDGAWHFYLQHTTGYRRLFPFDIQKIDLGIAMCHFALAAEEQGLSGAWVFQPPLDNLLPEGLEYIMTWSQN